MGLLDRMKDMSVGDNIGGIGIEYPDENAVPEKTEPDPKELNDQQLWDKVQELALDNKTELKKFLQVIIKADKTGEIQSIINSLTTVPEPAPEKEKPEEKPVPKATSIELDDIVVLDYIERHPKFLDKLDKVKGNLKVPTVRVFFRQDDEAKEHMLLYKDIKPKVLTKFDGDVEKACSPEGWYISEYRIADSGGNPTDAVYDGPHGG